MRKVIESHERIMKEMTVSVEVQNGPCDSLNVPIITHASETRVE